MTGLRWLRPEPADEPALTDLLDEAERVRAARFHHGADRLAYVAAHALLRTLLSEIAGGAPQAWRFVRSPTGKPRLEQGQGGADLRFSLSHARGLVACVVAEGMEVGVDVEPLQPTPDALRLARTWFSAREADRLQTMADPARSEAFLHLWTLKEAAGKATGAGLRDRLDQPEFDPTVIANSGERPRPLHPGDLTFQRLVLPGQFVLSLSLAGESRLEAVCSEARPGARPD